MRESRSSGSVEGVVGNHDSYSDSAGSLIDLHIFLNLTRLTLEEIGRPVSSFPPTVSKQVG
jgi:hypothetical protein